MFLYAMFSFSIHLFLGTNTCSPVYRGTNPFSEPETESVAQFLRTLDLAAYITVHSYYQLWMYPYGYTGRRSPDHDELVCSMLIDLIYQH